MKKILALALAATIMWATLSGCTEVILGVLKGGIKMKPTVDVAEVVYCKDCKYHKESDKLSPNKFCYRLLDRDGNHIGYNFADDDFCSYGAKMNCGAE